MVIVSRSVRSPLNTIAVLLLCHPAALAIEATGLDAITIPGKPTRVSAKFERGGIGPFQPDMARARVSFSVMGKTLSDLTDPDGVAEATITPITTGVYPIRATLVKKPKAPAANATLYVIDPARPVAVVDIDGTLSDHPGWRVPFDADDAKTFPGAPRLITDLAKTHQIVYLTARDEHFASDTRTFLARHAFPPGPVLFNRWGLVNKDERDQLDPDNHGAFKLKRLKKLQTRGLNITLGIGNAETDAEAYEGAKIQSCILTKVPGKGRTFRFKTYAQLRKRLVKDGVLKE